MLYWFTWFMYAVQWLVALTLCWWAYSRRRRHHRDEEKKSESTAGRQPGSATPAGLSHWNRAEQAIADVSLPKLIFLLLRGGVCKRLGVFTLVDKDNNGQGG